MPARRRILVGTAAAGLSLIVSPAWAATGEANAAGDRVLLHAVNAARQSAGLRPLRPHSLLAVAAQSQAEELSVFGDLSRRTDVGRRVESVGYQHQGLYEGAAIGMRTADAAAEYMLQSGFLREYLLKPEVSEIGIGHALRTFRSAAAAVHDNYWVVIVAKPVSALPPTSVVQNQLLAAVNSHRRKHGLRALVHDPSLIPIASAHAYDMARFERLMHVGSDGRTFDSRLKRAGYAFVSAAENLAVGTVSVEETVADWIASPGHNHNLLMRDATATAVAVVDGKRSLRSEIPRWWCQLLVQRPGAVRRS